MRRFGREPLPSLCYTLALACALLLGSSARVAARDEGILRIAVGAPIRTLDVHAITGASESRVGEALFEGLTYLDPATLEPRPGVAKSWDRSPDGRTWTFHLRANARWSDGRPVTALDFAWSWRRLMEPHTDAPYAPLLYGVRGARALNRYGADADRVLGTPTEPGSLIEDVRRLARAHPEAVDAVVWHRFVLSSGLADAVRGTKDPLLRRALRTQDGTLGPPALEAIQKALRIEAWRRRAAHQGADAAFGTTLGVRATTDHTLVVDLEAPQPYFLELVASPSAAPLPRHVLAGVANEWTWWGGSAIVGNGPFRLAARGRAGRLRLERSATYWNRDAIRLAAAEILPIASDDEAVARFQRGEVDWCTSVPFALRDSLRGQPILRTSPSHVVYFYRINCTHPVLKNVDVRRALALAIHRESLVARGRGKGALPTGRFVPPGMPGYEPPEAEQRFALPRAQFLLAEAGYPGGKGIEPLTLVFNTSEGHARMAAAFADEVQRRLGIELRPLEVEWQEFTGRVDALEYAVARAGWIGDYTDPATFLELFASDSPDNDTGWSSARYDRLLAAARDPVAALADPETWLSALTEPKRAARLLADVNSSKGERARERALTALRMHLLRAAETILIEDEVPIIPIYVYESCDLVQPRVQGFHTTLARPGSDGKPLPNGPGLHPLRGLFLER